MDSNSFYRAYEGYSKVEDQCHLLYIQCGFVKLNRSFLYNYNNIYFLKIYIE